MSDKKTDRIIPADQLTAYERWELPSMQPGGNDVIRSHVSSADVPVKPLTASDLETIRLEAYEAGFVEGKEEGAKQGHQEGVEKGYKEGLESGTQQGLKDGQQAGQQQKQAEIDQVNDRLSNVMGQLLEPIKLHEDEIEEALLNLVLTISRAVIMRELSLGSQQIRRTVKDALDSLPPSYSNVKIRINSVDYDSVLSIADSIADGVQVIKSDDILPGGCKVETLHSQIDATVEKRFQKTVQQMLDRHASSVPIDEAPDLTDSMEDMTDFHRDVLESKEYEDEDEAPMAATSPTPHAVETQTSDNNASDRSISERASVKSDEVEGEPIVVEGEPIVVEGEPIEDNATETNSVDSHSDDSSENSSDDRSEDGAIEHKASGEVAFDNSDANAASVDDVESHLKPDAIEDTIEKNKNTQAPEDTDEPS